MPVLFGRLDRELRTQRVVALAVRVGERSGRNRQTVFLSRHPRRAERPRAQFGGVLHEGDFHRLGAFSLAQTLQVDGCAVDPGQRIVEVEDDVLLRVQRRAAGYLHLERVGFGRVVFLLFLFFFLGRPPPCDRQILSCGLQHSGAVVLAVDEPSPQRIGHFLLDRIEPQRHRIAPGSHVLGEYLRRIEPFEKPACRSAGTGRRT